ncbi:MAG: DUF1887 family protein [Myxococcales bacterium]|nr:DUF1887 family protein [Myxococcales bacterium]
MAGGVHICLVSDQPTPNLTPALDPEFAPHEVILVVSPQMAERADWLEAVLRPRGVRCTRWPVQDAYDIEHLRERFLELLIAREDATLLLNATGGTKPMSLAAYEVCRQFERPVFYVNPETDHLVWLSHPARPPSRDLADRIRLGPFLIAHGATVTATGPSEGVPANLRGLTDALVADAEALAAPLAALNFLAGTAEHTLISEPQDGRQRRWPDLQALIDRFANVGCLTRSGDRLKFPDEDRRFFVQGGWLEAHVYGLIYGLRRERPTVQDVARGLEAARDVSGGRVRNEIDVAFLADNRLYVIECKTACMGREDAGNRALYKLDTLKAVLGGAQGRAMLVSFKPLRASELNRADELEIEVVAGSEVRRLRERLLQWIPGKLEDRISA